MDNMGLFSKNQKAVITGLCFTVFLMGLFLTTSSFPLMAGEKNIQKVISKLASGKILISEFDAVRLNQEMMARLQNKVNRLRYQELYQHKMRQYPAEMKIDAYLKALVEAEKEGLQLRAIFQSLSDEKRAVLAGKPSGNIAGVVSVSGSSATDAEITVLSFNRYGFFAGAAEVEKLTGEFTFSDMPAGRYYLVTVSRYRDKFFEKENSLAANLYESWQNAQLVTVRNGETTNGIAFDLDGEQQTEASIRITDRLYPETDLNSNIRKNNILQTNDSSIQGMVNFIDTVADDTTALFFAAIFAFDTQDTSIATFNISGFDGSYELPELNQGTFVVYANNYLSFLLGSPATQGEYYDDAKVSADATPLVLAESDTLRGIDFYLETGGSISGRITDANGAILDSVVVVAVKKFAFDEVGSFFADDIDFGVGFSDTTGNYFVSGLSSGDYVLRTVSLLNPDFQSLFGDELGTGKHFGEVLDAYYPNVQSIYDPGSATPVSVTSPDNTGGINFVLDLAGGINGKFVEASDGTTPVNGTGTVIALNAANNLPELTFAVSDSINGTYELRPLPTGYFKLFGFVDSDDVLYLPQFYDGKGFESADSVQVTAPTVTPNIDFKMVRTGTIAGTVSVPGQNVAELGLEISVLAYNAVTQTVAGIVDADSATGTYSLIGLWPANYKVQAFVGAPDLAATYHGGGTSFNDPNSVTVNVAAGGTTTADIALAQGQGVIMGAVYQEDGQTPIPGTLVLAYDESGHVVSGGLAGLDLNSGGLDPTSGAYAVPGLVSGNYFLRTVSLFRFLLLLDEANLGDDGGGDPLSAIIALLLGDDSVLDSLDVQLFGDAWYNPNQFVGVQLANLDLFSIFANLLFAGDPQALLPFFQDVPGEAMQVTVTSPGLATGKDFKLPAVDLGGLLTDVDESPGVVGAPERFQLAQNYPNPFNPSTVINYTVPQAATIQLHVYNLLGQRIRSLFDGHRLAGEYKVQWDGRNERGEQVAAGIYFLRMETDKLTISRKMLLVK
ncbi:MAG: T9SS type A sorting domain-containing protein [bacterium]